jgi:hypothetical protein
MRHVFQIAASVVALLTFLAQAQAEPVPPPAKSIKAEETAILLVDFQGNFVSPAERGTASSRNITRTRACSIVSSTT